MARCRPDRSGSFGRGALYAGGNFAAAGDVAASYIAKWDGTNWSALGAGLDGPVYALAVNGTDIYVGGSFTTAGGVPAHSIAKWNGSNWSAVGSEIDGIVYAFAVSGPNLLAGGISGQVYRWAGSSWSALGTGVAGPRVTALAVSGSHLYAAGNFATAGGSTANDIARWDGTNWSALGSGLNYLSASALAATASELFAGGSFTFAGGKVSGYAARAIIGPPYWFSLQAHNPGPHTNRLMFVGIPGVRYSTQYATNLPPSFWQPLTSNAPAGNGF